MTAQDRRGAVGNVVGLALIGLLTVPPPARIAAQDYSVLRINEVIAENATTNPTDVAPAGQLGDRTDMIEIINTGNETLTVGASNTNQSLALTDTLTLPCPSSNPPTPPAWTFRNQTTILPGGRLVVFCDGDTHEDPCEAHASFQIASDGSEPVTLWGPFIGTDAEGCPLRQIIDQVWLPPLRSDVSFGRFPDGAGPAPVPLEEVMNTFHFNPPGQATLGACTALAADCTTNPVQKKRLCQGAPNGPGGNLDPRIQIETYSTNMPAAGEVVSFRVKVDDDGDPRPPNIASVQILYSVNGGSEQTASMVYDSSSGRQQGVIADCNGSLPGVEPCPNPFDFWTFWEGLIPGQPAGSRIEFYFRVRDADGGEDTSPDTLCASGVGPCDRDFGGPGCTRDFEDRTCESEPVQGERYLPCRRPFTYTVDYEPPAGLASLAINEVVPNQDNILQDLAEACTEKECENRPANCCRYDDFIEVFNSSATQAADMSGLWLSDGPFNPQVWQFPVGSIIQPEEYLIVWLDRDGAQCPEPVRPDPPCFWECPDPTNPASKEYHTNFALNAAGDEVFLFDTEAGKFGVIHGVAFANVPLNQSLELIPNGDKTGCWVVDDSPTPRGPNSGTCAGASFRRGDSNDSCRVDLSDTIFTLANLFQGGPSPLCPDAADANDSGRIDISDAIWSLSFLFQGGPPPLDPGPYTGGPDPTGDDDLGPCEAPSC